MNYEMGAGNRSLKLRDEVGRGGKINGKTYMYDLKI
jgi:hypothetical protein